MPMQEKPFSQACENNKIPILTVLKRIFAQAKHVLEIGSGTGQHASYFAQHLPHLRWTPSDRPDNHPGIDAWQRAYSGSNLAAVKTFDIRYDPWPEPGADAVFSANTAHIMPWPVTQLMLEKTADHLPKHGLFALYGPFNYQGKYTSESNAHFDQWLKQSNSEQGIRDFEAIDTLANNKHLSLLEDNPMPANNRLLVWQKR